MEFQLPLYAISAACLLLAGVLATASIPRNGGDLRLWIGALVFVAWTDVVLAHQPLLGSHATSVLVAGATSLGLALTHLALQHLLGGRPVYAYAFAPVLLAVAGAHLFATDPIVRTCLVGTVYASQAAHNLVLLLSSRQRRIDAPVLLLTAGFSIICAVFIIRVTVVLKRPELLISTLTDRPAHSATLLLAIAGIAVCSFAFMAMRRNQYEERMVEFATRDALTGTLNRRMLMELGARAVTVANRSKQPLSALMVDLDHFKEVNDRHGHASGDLLLQQVAASIAQKLRGSDIFARYGGEEFCVLLPGTSTTGATITADRIRVAIGSGKYLFGKEESRVTVSIGIATSPGGPSVTLDSLITHADAALYGAKRNGRDQVQAAPASALLTQAAGKS